MKGLHLIASQRRMLAAICRLTIEGPTTVRDVMRELGHASTGSTYDGLHRLRDHGVIRWEPKLNRTLRPDDHVVLVGGEPYWAEPVS